uniref:Uncharacterized protein LOC100177570 n=1 Tax=Phallusia mammillata TaxID=59560 RepID=A0A6F9DG06_9ASCI|nr:uncharacterized protein LOC100177570 [Phallusia mammillata]
MKVFKIFLIVVAILWPSAAKETRKSLNMDPIDVSVWNLPLDEKYPTTVELDKDNFEQLLLRNDDAWIILFHKGTISKKWISHAKYLKGAVWHGTVDVRTNNELASTWVPNFLTDESESTTSVVFPFGKKEKVKVLLSKTAHQFDSTKKAQQNIVSTSSIVFPELDFSNQRIKFFHDWVISTYYKPPRSRFPVLCLTDEENPPPVLHTLQLYFKEHFSFGTVYKKDVASLRTRFRDIPEPGMYPHFLILLGREPSKKEYEAGKTGLFFDVFPFIEKKYGNPSDFTAIVKFLFTANEDYRKDLPGRRPDESPEMSKMESVRKALRRRVQMKRVPKRSQKEEL